MTIYQAIVFIGIPIGVVWDEYFRWQVRVTRRYIAMKEALDTQSAKG